MESYLHTLVQEEGKTIITTHHSYLENLKEYLTTGKVQSRHKNLLSIVIDSFQLLLLHRSCRLHTSTTQQPHTHNQT